MTALRTTRSRTIAAVVAFVVLWDGGWAAIGYPLTHDPAMFYMPTVTLAGAALLCLVMFAVMVWIERGSDR